MGKLYRYTGEGSRRCTWWVEVRRQFKKVDILSTCRHIGGQRRNEALCKEHALLEFATDVDALFVLVEVAAHFWHLFFERFASFPVRSGTLRDEGGKPDGGALGSTENHNYLTPK